MRFRAPVVFVVSVIGTLYAFGAPVPGWADMY